jgi:hypothetical protein
MRSGAKPVACRHDVADFVRCHEVRKTEIRRIRRQLW